MGDPTQRSVRATLAALCVLGVLAFLPAAAAAQAEEIVCGRIMGHYRATPTGSGDFVVVERSPTGAAIATYILIPEGAQFSYDAASWVCVRTTSAPPTRTYDGSTATRTFVAFVAPGSAGYRAEPTAAPVPSASPAAVGSLPSTTTGAPPPPAQLALGVAALVLAGAVHLLRRNA